MNLEPNPHSYNIEFSGYIISFPYFEKTSQTHETQNWKKTIY